MTEQELLFTACLRGQLAALSAKVRLLALTQGGPREYVLDQVVCRIINKALPKEKRCRYWRPGNGDACRPCFAQHAAHRHACPLIQEKQEHRCELPKVRNPLGVAPECGKAVERIHQALNRQERIVLFGDYDCDGITSVVLMHDVLRAAGCQPSSLDWFIPNRMRHGYGLSQLAVAECYAKKSPNLLIALDCGTTSIAQVNWLAERGVDCVVLDHHQVPADMNPELLT